MFAILQAAGWPILPLVVCSVLMLALVFERFMRLRENKVVPPNLLDEAMAVSRNGMPGPDVVNQLAASSDLGAVLASGFDAAQQPNCTEQQLRAAMEMSGQRVTHHLEKYLTALGTIASAAPLLGLLGTVIGMIEIFGAQAPSGGNNPAQLAHGISVALYNTAFGLIVAIPALIFWRYFRSRVDAYLLELEQAAERFAQQLLNLGRVQRGPSAR